MRKPISKVIPIVLVLILLALQGVKYGAQYIPQNILPPPPVSPITMAVAIYESETDDTLANYDQHQTMLGKTAQALRKVNKWRQYDKDHVPEKYLIYLSVVEKEQEGKMWEPWLFLLHSDTDCGWAGPMPESDDGLKQKIKENGGS